MKEYFPGFYKARYDDLIDFQQNATIVLDAYLLLDLLCVNEGKSFIDFLKDAKVENKLWLPYDAAWLYHNLMHDVLIEQIKHVKSSMSYLTSFKNSIDDKFSHPYISAELDGRFCNLIQELETGLNTEKDKLKNDLQNKEDGIISLIDKLYGKDNINIEYDEADLTRLYDEAKDRYSKRIPPGFLFDTEYKDERIKYHDYIVWSEMKKQAEEKKTDIMFVTNRIRSDWFFIYDDEIIGARKELINEFEGITKHKICIVTVHSFIEENIKNIERNTGERYSDLLNVFSEKPFYAYNVQHKKEHYTAYVDDNEIG